MGALTVPFFISTPGADKISKQGDARTESSKEGNKTS